MLAKWDGIPPEEDYKLWENRQIAEDRHLQTGKKNMWTLLVPTLAMLVWYIWKLGRQ